jgi:hypothetical protein
MGDACDCGPLNEVDYWFEIGPDGAVVERSGPIPDEIRAAIAQHAGAARGGGMEGGCACARCPVMRCA